jgi:hypothetical protein
MEAKKAQGWGFDLAVAAIIFVVGIVVFFLFSINAHNETAESFDNLEYEAGIIADSLFSEGSPSSWTESNVVRLGLLSNNQINETKLAMFSSLAGADYQKTKQLFRIKGNYYITFSENLSANEQMIDLIGQQPVEAQNLLKVTRLSNYNGKPIVFYIHSWD